MGQVAGYGGVHGGLGVFELGLVEHLGVFGLLLVGAGEEELLLAMFGKDLNKVGEILVAEEYFALAVLYVVLQVEGNGENHHCDDQHNDNHGRHRAQAF